MKKGFILSGFAFLIIFMVTSCELLDDITPGDTNVIDEIEGQWKVDEINDLKSTKTEDNYYVYISPDPNDTTKVLISNFFHLGNNVEASGKVSGSKITLARQSLPGDFIILSGSGTISSNYKTITWSYTVDDGSDSPVNATATYTKSY